MITRSDYQGKRKHKKTKAAVNIRLVKRREKMGNIHNSITELVGNTPIVEFHRLKEALGLKGRIAGKLEYFNPAGSHKDRMALEIIEAAERRGDISPDKTTLVEFTSGNTGVAMAAFAAAKGYKFKIGVQNGVSIERSKLLEAYQANIATDIPQELIDGVFEKGIAAFSEVRQAFSHNDALICRTVRSGTARTIALPLPWRQWVKLIYLID